MENKKEDKKIIRKKFSGVVVGDKNDKTVIVSVDSTKINKKYQKRYVSSKKYKVHDEENKYKVGDNIHVVIETPSDDSKTASAIRTLIIPQEYFVDDLPSEEVDEDEEESES